MNEPDHKGRIVSVFNSIARCPNVKACYDGGGGDCRAIVRDQVEKYGAVRYVDFQVPEPWVGRIDLAPILFVSSNPSIGKDDHARGETPDNVIWESHHLAFGGGSRPYVLDGVWTTDVSGAPIKRVRYWSWARRRAMELIPNAVPGTDYAMTEIVHCKSAGETGVADAAPTCIKRHFDDVMSVAAAQIVVAVGAFAQRQFFRGAAPDHPVDMNLGSRPRVVVALAHPSSFMSGKTFGKRYTAEDVARLVAVVSVTNIHRTEL